jgi:hypothetical protein
MEYMKKEKPETPKLDLIKPEPVKPREPKPSGLTVTRIEGFLQDVKKVIDGLPAGEVPVEFSYENQNVRIMGRGVFLLVTKKDPTSKLKCISVIAMGLENLNKELQGVDLTKTVDMFILPAQINKKTQMQQYLAILVGE